MSFHGTSSAQSILTSESSLDITLQCILYHNKCVEQPRSVNISVLDHDNLDHDPDTLLLQKCVETTLDHQRNEPPTRRVG